MSQISTTVFDLLELTGKELDEITIRKIKSLAGHQKLFFGRKKENHNIGVLCTQWASPNAAGAYKSSGLAGAKETAVFEMEAAAIEPLAAPCTEVFTAYGAESGFLDNAKRFAEALGAEKPNGYFGSAVGEGVDGEGTVMMLLGWESVQAHGEAKGVDGGVIQRNIHELRSLRRSVDLFHVEFKEL